MSKLFSLVALFATLLFLTAPKADENINSRTDTLYLNEKECITAALKNSPVLKAEKHKLEAMEAKIGQVLWAPFSSFKIFGLTTFVDDKCVDPAFSSIAGVSESDQCKNSDKKWMGSSEDEINWGNWGPTFQLRITGAIPLFTFGKIKNAKKAMRSAYESKKELYPGFEFKIIENVKRAYNAVWGAREMAYTIKKGEKHLLKAKEKIEQDLENERGDSTEIDLVKLKVFLNEVKRMKFVTDEIEKTGLAALKMLVGKHGHNKKIDIEDKPQEKIEITLLSLEEYKSFAINNRPELKALNKGIRALESKIKMERAGFFPDLALVMTWGVARTPGRPDINNWMLSDSFNYGPSLPGFALTISYNLDFGLDLYRLKEAKSNYLALNLFQSATYDGVMLQVEKTYNKVKALGSSLDSLAESKRLVKGWLSAESMNHQTGLSSFKDVKDALKEFFKIMASIHQLTHDYNTSYAALLTASGINPSGKTK